MPGSRPRPVDKFAVACGGGEPAARLDQLWRAWRCQAGAIQKTIDEGNRLVVSIKGGKASGAEALM